LFNIWVDPNEYAPGTKAQNHVQMDIEKAANPQPATRNISRKDAKAAKIEDGKIEARLDQ